MPFVNLTPHPINLHLPDGSVQTFAPSGAVARAAETRTQRGTLDGVAVELVAFGAVDGLPAQAADTLLIVSGLVLAACADRPDVLAPGQPVRDDQGRVVGCKGWTCTPAFAQDATPPTTPTTPRPSPAMPPSYRAWVAATHVPYTTAVVPAAPAPATPAEPAAPVAAKYVSPFGPPPASFVREAARKAAAADIPANVREQIGSWVSTNGRYGVALVAHPRHKGEAHFMQGCAIVAGRAAGTDVVRVDDAVGKWVRVVEKDADSCMGGAKIIHQRDLQSSRVVSVIETPEGGAWKEYGYKRRSSQWYTVRGGMVVTLAPYEALQLQGQGQGDNAH